MNWWCRSRLKQRKRRWILLFLGLALILALTPCPVGATGQGRSTPIVYQGQGDERRIALTFDDGPHPEYTAEILDILAEYGIRATFFVIGENVDLYPEVLQRTIAEGHEIGNHTQTHPLKNHYRLYQVPCRAVRDVQERRDLLRWRFCY